MSTRTTNSEATRAAIRARRFVLKIERDGDGWHAWLPEVEGCRTGGRSIATVRKGIREALATCEDVLGRRADEIAYEATFDEQITLPTVAQAPLRRRVQELEVVEVARRRADDATRKSVVVLLETLGLSLRDTGAILGMSHETVKQTLEREMLERASRPNPAPRVRLVKLRTRKLAAG